jgi:hypothetical protein
MGQRTSYSKREGRQSETPTLASCSENTIMTECMQKSGHSQSMYSLSLWSRQLDNGLLGVR